MKERGKVGGRKGGRKVETNPQAANNVTNESDDEVAEQFEAFLQDMEKAHEKEKAKTQGTKKSDENVPKSFQDHGLRNERDNSSEVRSASGFDGEDGDGAMEIETDTDVNVSRKPAPKRKARKQVNNKITDKELATSDETSQDGDNESSDRKRAKTRRGEQPAENNNDKRKKASYVSHQPSAEEAMDIRTDASESGTRESSPASHTGGRKARTRLVEKDPVKRDVKDDNVEVVEDNIKESLKKDMLKRNENETVSTGLKTEKYTASDKVSLPDVKQRVARRRYEEPGIEEISECDEDFTGRGKHRRGMNQPEKYESEETDAEVKERKGRKKKKKGGKASKKLNQNIVAETQKDFFSSTEDEGAVNIQREKAQSDRFSSGEEDGKEIVLRAEVYHRASSVYEPRREEQRASNMYEPILEEDQLYSKKFVNKCLTQ